jgi:hypothetical protein
MTDHDHGAIHASHRRHFRGKVSNPISDGQSLYLLLTHDH